MKKVLASVVALGLLMPVMASASVACGQIDPANGKIVQCGGGNPELVVNVWGTMNSQLPHIAPGSSVVDIKGRVFTCPAWFSTYCVDLTKTTWFLGRL